MKNFNNFHKLNENIPSNEEKELKDTIKDWSNSGTQYKGIDLFKFYVSDCHDELYELIVNKITGYDRIPHKI